MGGNVEVFNFLWFFGMLFNVKTWDGRYFIELFVDNVFCFVENIDEEEFVIFMF